MSADVGGDRNGADDAGDAADARAHEPGDRPNVGVLDRTADSTGGERDGGDSDAGVVDSAGDDSEPATGATSGVPAADDAASSGGGSTEETAASTDSVVEEADTGDDTSADFRSSGAGNDAALAVWQAPERTVDEEESPPTAVPHEDADDT